MSLLETSLVWTVWLISPRHVPRQTLTVLLISPRDVFAGDPFSMDSLVDISQTCSQTDINSFVDISQTCLCWRPLQYGQFDSYLPEMSLLETSLVWTVWLISPRHVPRQTLTVLLISPRHVFAGDLFSMDSLVNISQRCSQTDINSFVDIFQRCLCWRPL